MEEQKKKKITTGMIAYVIIALIIIGILVAFMFTIWHPKSSGTSPLLPFTQQGRTASSVTYIISQAPEEAKVYGTCISFIHEGNIAQITANLYDSSELLVAQFTSIGCWTYHNNTTADTLDFEAGMKIVFIAPSISPGDEITISPSAGMGTIILTVI